MGREKAKGDEEPIAEKALGFIYDIQMLRAEGLDRKSAFWAAGSMNEMAHTHIMEARAIVSEARSWSPQDIGDW